MRTRRMSLRIINQDNGEIFHPILQARVNDKFPKFTVISQGLPINSHYIKKYSKPEYDLTRYYDASYENASDDILAQMSIRCGLYGLENILFGKSNAALI